MTKLWFKAGGTSTVLWNGTNPCDSATCPCSTTPSVCTACVGNVANTTYIIRLSGITGSGCSVLNADHTVTYQGNIGPNSSCLWERDFSSGGHTWTVQFTIGQDGNFGLEVEVFRDGVSQGDFYTANGSALACTTFSAVNVPFDFNAGATCTVTSATCTVNP